MNLKVMFLMLILLILSICLIYFIYTFFRIENSNKKNKYKYIVFYTSGRKLIKDFLLTEEENKQLNDTLNKSPLVKFYQVMEVEDNVKRC
ncbi:MAG: hypothetical protein PUE26_09895 [Ruminococcus sp.]|nr:hypothetical protein [Ruminococcus sp.]MDD6710435.1 hypothetical protein [Ruminococcus sp.]